jgi:nitrogen-specific signal transduction histidine kinase
MRLYGSRQKFKFFFIITAAVIAVVSVWVTNVLVKNLSKEERKKIEIWAESVRLLSLQVADSEGDKEVINEYNKLLLRIVEDNITIPLLLTDDEDLILLHKNIDLPQENEVAFLQKKLTAFKSKNMPIILEMEDQTHQYVYYDESKVLKQLFIFPYVQLLIVFGFIIISFFALSSTKKAEQNKVWVGLSKETAHQLGTPISALMAWMEYLRTQAINPAMLAEIDKDVQRLNMIADRFSKIGSHPDLSPIHVNEAIRRSMDYMGRRISTKVSIIYDFPEEAVWALMNESLFGWVIENLIKNAVDAMDGKGIITFSLKQTDKLVKIDVSDTGKGIPKSKFETVFHPGYTTKKRGWGLGLSLVRRIIDSYSKGRIFVLSSETNKGTSFRIELKRSLPS